ncbi:MAG: sodium:solute symporter [Myxococcales bacterium]
MQLTTAQGALAQEVRCDRRTRTAYALPGFALALVGIPVFVYLPKFYTDVVGVSMTVFGAIFLIARVLDAFVDPWIGVVSDRTRSRLGRRRPYLVWGALPLALAAVWLYVPPLLGATGSAIWLAIGVAAFFFLWTLVTIPYRSLGPELTPDYDERTVLFGWRDAAIIGGTMVAAAAVPAVGDAFGLPDTSSGERRRFLIYVAIAAPVLVWSCLRCAQVVRERVATTPAHPTGLLRGTAEALRNRPFAVLLAAYTVSAFGSNLPASLIPYYTEHVLHADIVGPIFILYFTVGISFIPLWVRAARRYGKKAAFLVATACNTGAFSFVFFLGEGDVLAYFVLVGLSGIGAGAVIVMPNSMQADVIDYDELRTGRRREGQFVGLWSVAEKFAAAVGVGLALPILGLAGYKPNQQQTPEVLLTLRCLYVLVPVACNLAAFGLTLLYPIDRKSHEAIRAAIQRREGGSAVVDPLDETRILQ